MAESASPSPGERADGSQARGRRIGLVAWFLLLSLLSVTAVSVTAAVLLSRYMTENLLRHDARLTTEFVNHMFAFEDADDAFDGTPKKPPPAALARFFTHVGQMPDILRANIYLLDGTVFCSTDKTIVGLRFPENDELVAATAGKPQSSIGHIGAPDKDEHVNLARLGTRFVENYLPMYRDGNSAQPVVAVAEIYRTPHDLFATIQTGQRLIFVGAAVGALLIVGTLVSLVRYADRLIRRQEREIADSERLATAGEMAAAVAHGLRNPLAAIRSSAELALRLRASERVFPLLDDIVLQSDRLEHWARQYLTAAEPQAVERCEDIGPVVASVRASLATELDRQRIVWESRLDPSLPPLAIGPALLEQLLSSVAANALEAMPDGGTITLSSVRTGGGMAELRVADTGQGMTREQLARVFLRDLETVRARPRPGAGPPDLGASPRRNLSEE
jgi:two-component system sensor histidine kinase HydH